MERVVDSCSLNAGYRFSMIILTQGNSSTAEGIIDT